MEETRGTRDDLHLKPLEYSIDAAKSFGFKLDDELLDALVKEYRGGTRHDEEEAVASAILRTGLVHGAATCLQQPLARGYYEPLYHFYVLVSATKGALDGLALWLRHRRNLPIRNAQCDFTKARFREKVDWSPPVSIRGLVETWLDAIRDYSIWIEHRGTMPIARLVDPVTGEHKGYDVLVDRATSAWSCDPDDWGDVDDAGNMALCWRTRLAEFFSWVARDGMKR
jgi:hypothetical protein